jgi:hypothetical protein
LAALGFATFLTTFACAAFGASELSRKVPALRLQPTFEVPCFLMKTCVAAFSVAWEARLGKEPVAAASRGAIAAAWAHDGAVTFACLVLFAAHVSVQSLRGDARVWNDWRAASFGGCAWVGCVTLAARQFGGFGPVRAFAFLRDADAAGVFETAGPRENRRPTPRSRSGARSSACRFRRSWRCART